MQKQMIQKQQRIYKQNLSRKKLNNGHFYLHPAVTPVGTVQQQMSISTSIPALGLLKK